jgi:hypothetical protein
MLGRVLRGGEGGGGEGGEGDDRANLLYMGLAFGNHHRYWATDCLAFSADGGGMESPTGNPYWIYERRTPLPRQRHIVVLTPISLWSKG